MLVILGDNFGVAGVGGEIDCQGNQFFADDVFRTVNDELVDQWDALCVGEGRFQLVFLTEVVQQLQD